MRSSAAAQQWAVRIASILQPTERILRWALRLGHAAQAVIGVKGMRALDSDS